MFEIADLYVSSLEASEYASFLRDLLFSIVDAGGGLPVRKRTSAARESAYDTRKDQPGYAKLDMTGTDGGDRQGIAVASSSSSPEHQKKNKMKKGKSRKKSPTGKESSSDNHKEQVQTGLLIPSSSGAMAKSSTGGAESASGRCSDGDDVAVRRSPTTKRRGSQPKKFSGADEWQNGCYTTDSPRGSASNDSFVWRAGGTDSGWSTAGADLSMTRQAFTRDQHSVSAWRGGGTDHGWSTVGPDGGYSTADGPSRSRSPGGMAWKSGGTSAGWSTTKSDLSTGSTVSTSRATTSEAVWRGGGDGWSTRQANNDTHVDDGRSGRADETGRDISNRWRGGGTQEGWSTRQVDHNPSTNRIGTTERDQSGVWRPGGTGRAWRTASDSGSEANVHAEDADAVGARSAQGPAPTRKARATSSSEANVSSTYDHDARSPSLESRSRTSGAGGAVFLRKNKRNVSTPLPRPKPTQVLCPYAAAAGLALPWSAPRAPTAAAKSLQLSPDALYPRSLFAYKGATPNSYRRAVSQYRLSSYEQQRQMLPKLMGDLFGQGDEEAGARSSAGVCVGVPLIRNTMTEAVRSVSMPCLPSASMYSMPSREHTRALGWCTRPRASPMMALCPLPPS